MDEQEQFTELVEKLTKKAEKIGLYTNHTMIATKGEEMDEEMESQVSNSASIKERMANGEVQVAIVALYTIGEVAFTDRVQNPEKYDMDKQFLEIMPTEAELKAEEIRDRIRKNKGNLFNFGDEDEA